uniref:Glyco_18 domain-containing protein n=1 Tax=Angiostrongylus cantonensis TaxID=6313 RepID=A0A158PAV8_ANGCA
MFLIVVFLLSLTLINGVQTASCAFYCFVSPALKETFDIRSYRNLSCTHFVYGFSRIRPDMTLHGVTARDNMDVMKPGNLRKFLGFRSTHVNSTLLLGVYFSERDVIRDIRHIRRTAKHLVDVVEQKHLDGLFIRIDGPILESTISQHFLSAVSMAPSKPSFKTTLAISPRWMWRIGDRLNDLVDYVDHIYIAMEELPVWTFLSNYTQKLNNFYKVSFNSFAASAVVLQGKNNWTSANFPKEQSLGKKIHWINQQGLGGVGLSSLQLDDPSDSCGLGQYPSHMMIGKVLKCRTRDHHRQSLAQCTRLCYLDKGAEKFDPWSLQPFWCSHLVIGPVDIQLTDAIEVSVPVRNLISRVNDWMQKSDNNKAKIVLSIGAQQTNDIWRMELSIPIKRMNLINNIKNTVRSMNASGVEISWTFEPLGSVMDTSLLSQFLVDLRAVLPQAIQVFLSIDPNSNNNELYDRSVISSTTDLIILQTHRLHSSREAFSGHHSPMFAGPAIQDSRMTVESFVRSWIYRGVPREKLVVSVTSVPTSVTLKQELSSTDKVFGIPVIPNPLTLGNHILSQTEICEEVKNNNSRVHWIEESGVPVLFHGSVFVAFDNEKSAKIKATWTSLNNLAGVAIHGLPQDNPNADCPDRPFPILQSIVDTQVCTLCAVMSQSKCSSSFQIVCNYRLPAFDEAQRLDASKIPFELCTEVVVEHGVIDANATVRFPSEEQRYVAKQLSGFRSNMKNMVISLRCGMEKGEFVEFMLSRESKNDRKPFALTNVKRRSGKDLDHFIKIFCLYFSFSAWHSNLRANYDITLLNSLHHVVLEPFSVPLLSDGAAVHSPLFSVGITNKSTTSIDSTIRDWERSGLMPSKILLQVPSYGMEQSLLNWTDIGIGRPTEKEYAVIGQAEKKVEKNACGEKEDWKRTIRLLINGFVLDFAYKRRSFHMRYALREGLAGVGLMSLNEDDHMGVCGSGVFPILRSISVRCH